MFHAIHAGIIPVVTSSDVNCGIPAFAPVDRGVDYHLTVDLAVTSVFSLPHFPHPTLRYKVVGLAVFWVT